MSDVKEPGTVKGTLKAFKQVINGLAPTVSFTPSDGSAWCSEHGTKSHERCDTCSSASVASIADIAKQFMRDRYGKTPEGDQGRDNYHSTLGVVFDAMDYYAHREWENPPNRDASKPKTL